MLRLGCWRTQPFGRCARLPRERWPALGKKARTEQRTVVRVDDAGFYPLPFVLRTYAPRGQAPVLRVPLTHEQFSVISGVSEDGRLFTH